MAGTKLVASEIVCDLADSMSASKDSDGVYRISFGEAILNNVLIYLEDKSYYQVCRKRYGSTVARYMESI